MEYGKCFLVLRGRGDSALHRQVAEEGGHLRRTHLGRMPFLMKENVLLNPVDVGFFSASTVMPDSHQGSELLKQLRHGKVPLFGSVAFG
jgi:hypothetical protein